MDLIDNPTIFDRKGEFVRLDQSVLDAMPAARRAAYDGIKSMCKVLADADERLAAAQRNRAALADERDALQEYTRKRFPGGEAAFMAEWKAMKR